MAYEDLKPFNKMSQWASKNGGPDKAIKLLEETNRLLGEKIGFQKEINKENSESSEVKEQGVADTPQGSP